MPHTLRASCLLASLWLAACGSPAPPAAPGNATPAAGGCPDGAAVRPASWEKALTADDSYEYGGFTYGAPPTAHWEIPLRVEVLDWENPPPASTFGPRTEADVRAQNPGPLGADAWIYRSGTEEPCRAPVTGYYLGRDNDGGPDFGVLAAYVEGCAPEEAPSFVSWAVLGAGEPTGCKLAEPTPITGTGYSIDESGVRFDDPVALPAPLAAAVPPRDCAPPACHPIWFATQLTTPDLELADLTASWVLPTAADYCEWDSDSHHGIYLGPPGGPLTLAPLENPLALAGVLHDARGARLLLTDGNGEYGVHALDGGRLGAGRFATRYVGHEEEYSPFAAWYVCGP
jgi:hypothetical protein